MQYTAVAKNLKMSPRKMRLVVDGIKKMPVPSALSTLSIANRRASGPIKKALESAIANAVNNGKVKKDDLYISGMTVNEGVSYKRYHYAGRGRMRPYKHRTSHLNVILGVKEAPKVEIAAKAEEPKKGGSAK